DRPRDGRRTIRATGKVELLGRKTEQAHVVLGMPGLARTDDRRWAMGVLNTALGGGMSSRLFQEVREKRGLAYSVYSYTSGFADCGLFGVYAGCRPSQVHDVLKICRDELDHVAQNGLTDDEIAAPSASSGAPTVLGLEDTGALMNRIGKSELLLGRADVRRRHAGPDSRGHPGRGPVGRPRHPRTASVAVRHRPAEGQAGLPAARRGRLNHHR
ncbi:peptidase M16-like protein, partial [Streptomyces sp. PanSC9]